MLRSPELCATRVGIRPEGLLSLHPFRPEDHRPIILAVLFIESCQTVLLVSVSNASADHLLYPAILHTDVVAPSPTHCLESKSEPWR